MANRQEMAEQLAAAEQRGIAKGMIAAAGIAASHFERAEATDGECWWEYGVDVEAAILAAAEKDYIVDADKMVCEWKTIKRDGEYWLESVCGTPINAKYMHIGGVNFCPYCGKPIKINGN